MGRAMAYQPTDSGRPVQTPTVRAVTRPPQTAPSSELTATEWLENVGGHNGRLTASSRRSPTARRCEGAPPASHTPSRSGPATPPGPAGERDVVKSLVAAHLVVGTVERGEAPLGPSERVVSSISFDQHLGDLHEVARVDRSWANSSTRASTSPAAFARCSRIFTRWK